MVEAVGKDDGAGYGAERRAGVGPAGGETRSGASIARAVTSTISGNFCWRAALCFDRHSEKVPRLNGHRA